MVKHTNLELQLGDNCIKKPFMKREHFNGEEAFHVRKPIESLETAKQIAKVVDESIRLFNFKKRVKRIRRFCKR